MPDPPVNVETDADPTYTHFTHRDEFTRLLDDFLGWAILDHEFVEADEADKERKLVEQMGGILDHYLPLPPLLDPYLHTIIPPLMARLSTHFHALWQAAEHAKPQHMTAVEGQSPPSRIYSNVERLAAVGRLLNWVVKVRGRKIAGKSSRNGVLACPQLTFAQYTVAHFPSEISNLPVLIYLLSPPSTTRMEPPTTTTTTTTDEEFPCHPALAAAKSWEIRSICFLWLSLLLTVPFDLSAFDTVQPPPPRTAKTDASSFTLAAARETHDPTSTAAQVLAIGKQTLRVPSKEGEYCSLLLARLFSRNDGVEGLPAFFRWVEGQLGMREDGGAAGVARADGNQAVFLTNILALLAQLPSLLPHARTHLPKLLEFYTSVIAPHVEGTPSTHGPSGSSTGSTGVAVTSNGLLRKMAVKARGRWWIAMLETTMGDAGKTRRGARGRHVLPIQDGQANVLQSLDCQQGKADVQEEEEEEFDPPDGLEEEIERLMGCLSDKDTIVRYSAAKYISRIADLLPRSLASQIVESTIALFSGTPEDPLVETERGKVVDPGGGSNGDAKWHGLCLALAEMGRRGLIGDEMVGDLLGWAVKALNFDIRRGAHSIGSNVRDAAAYLIWSLARALPPSTIRPYTDRIAQVLVCVACFDREVGIRRAASAAFQEHVGRMGLFPHGIDVLRKTDFYSVSVRRTAFLISAPQVAIHEEYRSAMLEHLHYVTLRHWDPAMRLIGAQSLKLICELEESLPAQALHLEIDQLGSVELANIHGALAALDELASVYRDRDDQHRLAEIFGSLCSVRASAFAIPGSDLLLEAACRVISRTACKDAVHNKANWNVCCRILDLGCRSGRPAQKQSFALALGQADYTQTPELLQPVLQCLLSNVSISTKAVQQDVETRRGSYQSILEILRVSEHSAIHVSAEEFFQCYQSFLDGLDDYSTDQRGDVGSWIRIACAQALPILTRMANAVDAKLGNAGCLQAVYGLIKLSVEKLETVRVVAGPALCEILGEQGSALGLEDVSRHLETIRDWKDVQSLYAAMGALLPFQGVQQPVFEGLILSLGGKNLMTQNAAATAITRSIHSISNSHPKLVEELTHALLTFGTENINKQRVFVPVLVAGYELAQADIWNELGATSGCSQDLIKLVNLAARGLTVIKNIERLSASMKFIVSCLAIPVAQKTAQRHVPNLIQHAYPRIRALTAEQLYLTLQGAGIEDPEMDELLLGVPWIEDGYKEAAADVLRLLNKLL